VLHTVPSRYLVQSLVGGLLQGDGLFGVEHGCSTAILSTKVAMIATSGETAN